MRAGDIQRAIDESRRIKHTLIRWSAVLVACIFFAIRPATWQEDWQAGIVIVAGITSIVAISLNLIAVRNLDNWRAENEPPPPSNDASDMLNFSAEHSPTVRLWQEEDNKIRVGRQQLRVNQWRTLARTLSTKRWRWTRQALDDAKVFKNLTAPGVYRNLTSDFERLGIVKQGRVTANGRAIICEAGGLGIVI